MGLSVEEAIKTICDYTKVINEVIELPIMEALGMVISEDVIAEINNPPFNRSPIDGYACHSSDVVDASKEQPITLKVICEVDAGDYYDGPVGKGECVRIMTGAPIPSACDCCLWQEKTNYGEEYVEVYKGEKPYANYCYAGEDYQKGTLLIKAGTTLTYVEEAVLASLGRETVKVYRHPRVVLVTTGSEVIKPGEALLPGKIYDINQHIIHAKMLELGLQPIYVKHVSDDAELLKQELLPYINNADLIITTGGVSVGKKDILHDTLPLLNAKQIFWGVNLKPGSPTIFSMVENTMIISLSGNPYGAIANFELLVRPCLAKMSQKASLATKEVEAIFDSEFNKKSHGKRYLRGIYQEGHVSLGNGLQSSGVISSMLGCNALIECPDGSEGVHQGDKVKVILI